VADSLEQLQARYDQLRRLYEVSSFIHATLDPQEALQRIVDEAVRLTRAGSGSAILHNPTTGLLEIQAARNLPPHAAELKLRPCEGITGWVARTGLPARVGDVRHDPRYIAVKTAVLSELAVPLEVSGVLRGVLNVDADRLDAFSPDDQELLEALALQAATVIRNTWVYEKIRLKARLFEALVAVAQTINSTVNLDETLRTVTREACILMEATVSSLLLVDETGEWLDLKASHGAGDAYLQRRRLSVAESMLGTVVRRKKPLQDVNVQTSSRFQHRQMARLEGLVSLLSVPLVFNREAIGVLNVYTSRPHSFSNEEVRVLRALAELSAIALQKARLYERIADVEELLRQNERLSALGLLAAEVAHEIRNPLTVMKMLYHSLDLRFGPEDPRERDAQIMGEKIDHLNKIVEQILDFARSAEPTFAQIEINEVIHELSLLVRHKLQQQSIALARHLDPDLPPLMADAGHLEQAFLNLTLNAVQAMPSGGTLTILTRTLRLPRRSPNPTHLLVEFRDSGAGMDPDQQKRLFRSLLATTKQGGTGLGLAIVKRVVETHQGKLSIRSRPGHGTRIRLLFPLNP